MALYNLTTIANSSTIVEFTQGVNSQLMQGWLGLMFLIIIFVVSLLSLIGNGFDPKKSIVSSLFVSFLVVMLLRILQLITDVWVIIVLALLGLSIFFLKTE